MFSADAEDGRDPTKLCAQQPRSRFRIAACSLHGGWDEPAIIPDHPETQLSSPHVFQLCNSFSDHPFLSTTDL